MSAYNLKDKRHIAYEGLLITKHEKQKVSDGIVVEAALQININGASYTVVMRTPGDDLDLIRGLLYAEDICKDSENFAFEVIEAQPNGFSIINIIIPKEKLGKGYLNKRTLLSVSSCGICGKQELKDIELTGDSLKNKQLFSTKEVQQMSQKMNDLQAVFKETGGSHAAAIFNKAYELLTIKEDIGRHNATDKAIGQMIASHQLKQAYCLFVSGRVSYEIISKAFIANIGVVVAVSACSSLAIDYAKEFGICLIGFSRTNKMTIYAHPRHVE